MLLPGGIGVSLAHLCSSVLHRMFVNVNEDSLTLSLIYTLSDACAADGFFKNIVTKEEIALFLLLPQSFPL